MGAAGAAVNGLGRPFTGAVVTLPIDFHLRFLSQKDGGNSQMDCLHALFTSDYYEISNAYLNV